MDTQTPQLDLLMDLDARHEELLRQLEELDKRVEKALVECQAFRSRPRQRPESDDRLGSRTYGFCPTSLSVWESFPAKLSTSGSSQTFASDRTESWQSGPRCRRQALAAGSPNFFVRFEFHSIRHIANGDLRGRPNGPKHDYN